MDSERRKIAQKGSAINHSCQKIPQHFRRRAISLQANKYGPLGASHGVDRQLTGFAGRLHFQRGSGVSARNCA